MFEKNDQSIIYNPAVVDKLILFENYFPKCSAAVANYEEILREQDWGNIDPR